jgi:hypothetical protein
MPDNRDLESHSLRLVEAPSMLFEGVFVFRAFILGIGYKIRGDESGHPPHPRRESPQHAGVHPAGRLLGDQSQRAAAGRLA